MPQEPDNRTALQKLLISWMEEPAKPSPKAAETLHIQLWCAVALECGEKKTMGIIIRPLEDPRIRWAAQFLDALTGDIKAPCPDLTATARFLLGLPPQDGEAPAIDNKSRAAGER